MRNTTGIAGTARAKASRHHGFTLLEVLLALSLFLVLLAVIFVPLNNAFQIFNAGRTSIALQGAADATVKKVAEELKGAIAVFPNDNLPGITDRLPYSTVDGTSYPPYYPTNACASESARIANTSRIDFILPNRTSVGAVSNPITRAPYLVTYYARRYKAYKAPTENAEPFDRYSNPIGMFRSQMPYYDSALGSPVLMLTDDTRYSGCTVAKDKWLMHTPANPPTQPLEPIFITPSNTSLNVAKDTADQGVQGDDTLVSPRDMGLGMANLSTMQPELSFQCEDTDSNGIIDRVTISLTLVQYEDGNSGTNGRPAGQRVTATQSVYLPNTKSGV